MTRKYPPPVTWREVAARLTLCTGRTYTEEDAQRAILRRFTGWSSWPNDDGSFAGITTLEAEIGMIAYADVAHEGAETGDWQHYDEMMKT